MVTGGPILAVTSYSLTSVPLSLLTLDIEFAQLFRKDGIGHRKPTVIEDTPAVCQTSIPAPSLSESQRDMKRSHGIETDGNSCLEIDSGQLRLIGSKAPGILHPPNSTKQGVTQLGSCLGSCARLGV